MQRKRLNEGENMKDWFVISGITFAVFLTEALIHYNYGINESSNQPISLSNFKFPNGSRFIVMAGIVMVASTISSSLITFVENKLS